MTIEAPPALRALPTPEHEVGREPSSIGAAVLVLGLIGTALVDGLYAAVDWHLAGLGLTVIAGVVFARGRVRWGPVELVAVLLLGLLAGWALASMLWSVAPGRSWVEANRVALYLVTLLVALAALRRAPSREAAILLSGLAVALLFAATLLIAGLGDTPSVFVLKRLDAPVGYVNGVAGLAAVALWPALAAATRLDRPSLAASGGGAASLLLSVMVLTQSRSVVPALLVSTFVVLVCVRGRAERLLALAVAAAGAALSAPWTLAVFAEDRANPFAAPSADVARAGVLAPLVSAVAVGVLWGLIARARQTRPAGAARAMRIAAAGLVVLCAAGGAVAAPTVVRTADRALDDFRAARIDEQISSRFTNGGGNRHELWRVAIAEWRRAPVLGIGAGGYGVRWYAERRVTESIRQPHSLGFQVLAELGLIGAALLLGLGGTLTWAAVLAVRSAATPAELGTVAGAIGSLLVWTVQTNLDWMHNLPTITGLALIAAATLLTAARRPSPGSEPGQAAPAPDGGGVRAGALAALLGLTVITASFGVQLAVNAYTSRSERLIARDAQAARVAAQHAVRLDRYAVPAWIALAASEARLGSYARADAALVQAIRAEPESYVGYALRGDLAARVGRNAEARALYGQALARNPLDPGLADLAMRTVVAP